MQRVARAKDVYFSLGHVGAIVYFWPAKPTWIRGKQFWELMPGGAEQILAEPILSLEDWEAPTGRRSASPHVFAGLVFICESSARALCPQTGISRRQHAS